MGIRSSQSIWSDQFDNVWKATSPYRQGRRDRKVSRVIPTLERARNQVDRPFLPTPTVKVHVCKLCFDRNFHMRIILIRQPRRRSVQGSCNRKKSRIASKKPPEPSQNSQKSVEDPRFWAETLGAISTIISPNVILGEKRGREERLRDVFILGEAIGCSFARFETLFIFVVNAGDSFENAVTTT